jgi:hypothetical protein
MLGGGGISLRMGAGLHRNYGQGDPSLPVPTRHGVRPAERPMPAGHQQLLLGGRPCADARPIGPVVDRHGKRVTTPAGGLAGVGTDLTDPSTWQRPYYFPEGSQPVIRQRPRFS